MSIRNRQIGWSQETSLWWEVFNALSKLKSSLGTPPGMPLFTTNDNKLYELNVNNGIATELSIPNFPIGGAIFVIHNDEKLYLNKSPGLNQNTVFHEYDITLTPWSASFVGSGTLTYGSINDSLRGACMKQNELTKGIYFGAQQADKIYTIDLTNLGSITSSVNFVPLLLDDDIYDVLQTTDNKFIVSAIIQAQGSEAVIQQYDSAGNLELNINTGLFSFIFLGIVVYNNEIYLIGSSVGFTVNKLYKINHEPPYNLTFIADIDTGGSRIISVSQLPRLCTRSFQI